MFPLISRGRVAHSSRRVPLARRLRQAVCLTLAASLAVAPGGCTRRFFRLAADKEVTEVLKEKDQVPRWGIDQFNGAPYPDPRARFADPSNPDRPPMPPDDPAAATLSPTPQKPGKAGIAYLEGDGYLALLEAWDAENRAARAAEEEREKKERERQAKGDDKDKEKAAPAKPDDKKDDKAPGGKVPPVPAKEKLPEETPKPRPADNRDKGDYPDKPTAVAAEPGKDGKPADGGPGCPCLNPLAQKTYLIKLEQAAELGVINSREFQNRREDLYLVALPVTAERFSFAAQFFATGFAIREHTGRQTPEGQHNRWRTGADGGFTKLFSTGALLLFRFANRSVFELTGNFARHTISESTINLDLIQPLLRGGGKAVTLEPLTQVERNLLYEIRRYARFREEFYVSIAAGADFFSILLPGFAQGFNGGAFATAIVTAAASPQVRPGFGGFGGLGLTGLAAPSQGYLPTVLIGSQLVNERKNVTNLERFFVLLQNIKPSGDVTQLQVDQIEQQLLNSRNTVLQREIDLRNALDNFKLQLGLPMTVNLELDDELLRPVARHMQRYEVLTNQFEDVRRAALDYGEPGAADQLRARLRKLFTTTELVRGTRFAREILGRWDDWAKLPPDGAELSRRLAALEQEANALRDRRDNEDGLSEADARRLARAKAEFDLGTLELELRQYEQKPWERLIDEAQRQATQARLYLEVETDFSDVLSQARNERLALLREAWPDAPPVRVEDCDLLRADLEVAQQVVTQTALLNRFDLMNARAQLVDAWRQVAVSANSLLGTFNIQYHMDIATPAGLAKPLDFEGSRSRHQLILNTELPLVRKLERNDYRTALIAFQRQRRAVMSAEDTVANTVRAEIRQLRLLAQNYKIQQRAVELAYYQVETSFDEFRAPPQVGGAAGGGRAANAAALTQQLLNAQSRLLQVQNQLFGFWINYQIFRLQLYRDMELMPLDSRGAWIDELSHLEHPTTDGADSPREQRGAGPAGDRAGAAAAAGVVP